MTPEPAAQPSQQPDDKIIGRISKAPSPRIETEEFVIHKDPRISATKLGEYLVTDASKQKTIIKSQKKAPKAIILHHRKTKTAFAASFSADGFNCDRLKASAAEIKASGKLKDTDWQKLDDKLSIKALEKLAGVVEKLGIKGAVRINRPKEGWGGIEFSGVKISIEPIVVFSFEDRKVTKVGAVMLYCTKDDSKALSKSLGGNCAGDYVGAMLLKLIENKLAHVGVPMASKCITLDVFRSEIHTAPKSFKTLLRHMEDACEVISLRWDGIEV